MSCCSCSTKSFLVERERILPSCSCSCSFLLLISITHLSPSMAVGKGSHGCIPSGLTVMLIDEDPTSLLFISVMLKVCHFTVESFDDAVKALYTLCMRRGEFDLVITDIHMLIMPAFELVERIVTEIGVPVITTSADGDPEVLQKAFMHGSCFHLVKPITFDDMDVVWKKAWGNEANISTELRREPGSPVAHGWVDFSDLVLDGPESADTEYVAELSQLTEFAFDFDPDVEGFPLDDIFLTEMLDGVNEEEKQDDQPTVGDGATQSDGATETGASK